jgi:fatty acid-binding protein 3
MADTLIGDWKLVSSENFEELMKELGVNMLMRKLGSTTKPNIKFSQNGDEWTMNTTSLVKSQSIAFKLNEEVPETTMDGRQVKSTFSVEGKKLVQTQKDDEGKVVCVIEREITDNGELKTVSSIYLLSFLFASPFI